MWKVIFVAIIFYLCEGKPHSAKKLCPVGGGDKDAACDYWQELGYCDPAKGYYDVMEEKCPVTCGLCKARPTPSPKPRIVKVNIQECLQAHNSKRDMHGAKPLTWDASLAAKAKDWALHLAKKDIFQHAPFSGAGENIKSFKKYGELGSCAEAVEEWYAEVSNYPFENPPKGVSGLTGHFTQLVWKSTSKVGVSIVAIQRGFITKTYVVARYTPPGNVWGKFEQEVGASIMARK